MPKARKITTQKIIIFGISIITLFVTPWSTADPINIGKNFLLVVLSSIVLTLILPNIKSSFREYKTLSISIFCYLLSLFLVFVFAPGWKIQQLFGAQGRNTGLLTFIALAILLYASAILADAEMLSMFRLALLVTGTLSQLYGYFQFVGLDPAPWINPDNPIIGFLGNSNFQSSLIGICICLLSPELISRPKKYPNYIACLGFTVLGIIQILLSRSVQGIFVLLAGFSITILLKTYKSRFKSKVIYLSTFFMVGVGFIAAGLINMGPLAKFIFTNTVTARYEYWQAGIKMAYTHPLFGVGLDSFGDWYRRSRTLAAMLRRDVMTNSAHNYFIDQFANGGIVLGMLYIALHVLVLRSIFRIVKNSVLDFKIVGLISAWIGFFSQEFIGISQIGLAVWGWVISGLIIGIDVRHSKMTESRIPIKNKTSGTNTKLRIIMGLMVGSSLAIAPVIADVKYFSALKSASEVKFYESATTFATPSKTQLRIITILQDNGFDERSLFLSNYLLSKNPEIYEAWVLVYSNPKSSQSLKENALQNMKRLEPNQYDK
jgi:O-antigen ligase